MHLGLESCVQHFVVLGDSFERSRTMFSANGPANGACRDWMWRLYIARVLYASNVPRDDIGKH